MTCSPTSSRAALATGLLLAALSGCLVVPLLAAPAAARLVAGPLGHAVASEPGVVEVLRGGGGRQRPTPHRGVWPLVPRPEVVRPFDAPETRWGAGHRGADLAGRPGQAVRTSLAGRVSFAGRVAGRGVVVVDHGATRTTYEPVLATVGRGERVAAGAAVGRLAASGGHCLLRTCLHWGLRRGDVYLDPLTLVDTPRPVRLLPW